MTSDKLNIFCVTNKTISHIEKSNYKIAAVGKGSFPDTYLKSDTLNKELVCRSIAFTTSGNVSLSMGSNLA